MAAGLFDMSDSDGDVTVALQPSIAAFIAVSEDEQPVGAVPAAGQVAVHADVPKSVCVDAAGSSTSTRKPDAASGAPSNKRTRRVHTSKRSNRMLTAITAPASGIGSCTSVFVSRSETGEGGVPVPLWPRYQLDGGGDGRILEFVVVGHNERWLQACADETATRRKGQRSVVRDRDRIGDVMKSLRARLKPALQVARRGSRDADASDESESSGQDDAK